MAFKTTTVIPISLGFVKVYLVKGEQNMLIDCGLPGMGEKIIKGIRQNGVDPEQISLIILTHNHGDHSGGTGRMKELTGAKVAVQRSAAEDLRQGKNSVTKPRGLVGRIMMKIVGGKPFPGVEPDILIDEEFSLAPFGVDGKVIHTPGHTPCSLTILIGGGTAVAGDMFTARGGKAGLSPFVDDMGRLKESLEKVVSFKPAVIHTSHGGSCSAEALGDLIGKM